MKANCKQFDSSDFVSHAGDIDGERNDLNELLEASGLSYTKVKDKLVADGGVTGMMSDDMVRVIIIRQVANALPTVSKRQAVFDMFPALFKSMCLD